MPAYSPFQKQLHDLEVSDLSMLKEVREGWYVEYKREIPNAASIAKSISAFANTYGGWLFLGVEQESNDNPVAGRFPGIGRKDTDAGLQRLRKAVADHLNPIAHFDVAVVWGDVDSSELAEDRAVICVYIPWSANAPHVHSRGMIYRRVGDGSEPKPETDRGVIDQIRNRGERIRNEFATWVARDPDFLESESRTPFLRLLLVADLWRDRDIWCDLNLN